MLDCQRLFNSYIEMIVWFLSLSLLCDILFTDLHMSNQPCLSWIKPTWSCWMIFLYVPVFSLLAFYLEFLHLCAPEIQVIVFWLWLYLVWNIRVMLASCNEIVGTSFSFSFIWGGRYAILVNFQDLKPIYNKQFYFYTLMGTYPPNKLQIIYSQ